MAFRIGEYTIGGFIRNSRRNSISGVIEFAPGWGCILNLCGNLKGELEGRDFQFTVREESRLHPDLQPGDFPQEIEDIDRQIGVIGDVEFHVRKVPTVPIDEFVRMSPDQQQQCTVERDVLYLEWYGNNGRVVAEMIGIQIEFIDEDDLSNGESVEASPIPEVDDDLGMGPDITQVFRDGFEQIDALAEPDEDPYGLFDKNLEADIAGSLREDIRYESDQSASRSWDEAIPGIDPEMKAMFEIWDEVLHGPQTPVTEMFDPLQLPRADAVHTDEEAWPLVSAIVSRLATCSVSFDMCEHATPVTAYRCLLEEILPIANVSPKAGPAGFVCSYSMWEFCDQCLADGE
ncbi:MAG: hypothetical protein AB8G99_17265 [Planctomycetaceae bacterium]